MNARPTLNPSDRIAIVNALMAQDREEVRGHQQAVLRLPYLMVPGFIAVWAFYDAHRSLKPILIIGQILLLAMYIVTSWVWFRRWLPAARACLNIREAYFKSQELLYQDPFQPLRSATPDDFRESHIDEYLWFPIAATVLAAIVALVFMVFY